MQRSKHSTIPRLVARSPITPFAPKRAFTLIEVIAGIVLAGTLLAGSLLAATKHAKQIQATRDKQNAIETLDRFLSQWSIADFQSTNAGKILQQARNEGWICDTHDLTIERRQLPNIENVSRIRIDIVSMQSGKRLAWAEVVAKDARTNQ